jgi:hypothetical protein
MASTFLAVTRVVGVLVTIYGVWYTIGATLWWGVPGLLEGLMFVSLGAIIFWSARPQ